MTARTGRRTKASARAVAADVLARVLDEGAWAAPLLDAALSRTPLATSEAARATDLVFGVLRTLPLLTRAIDAHRKDRRAIESFTRAVLLSSTYELAEHADRAYAIVSEAVGLVRQARGEGLSRFANAILRRVSEKPLSLDRTAFLTPELRQMIGRGLSADRAAAFIERSGQVPPLVLRVDRGIPDALAERIAIARPGAEILRSSIVPTALGVRGGGDPRRLPGYADGTFAVQDAGSQWIAGLVGARAGERVLDACAGRGGKTALLARAVGELGWVVAVDLHDNKLQQIRAELTRLGIRTNLEALALDLTVGVGPLAERSFDRILVDAPCTGLGTIGRRPELAQRLHDADAARMASVQASIVSRAATLLKPGGRLVYAVCSPTLEEGPRVAEKLLASLPGLRQIEQEPQFGPWLEELLQDAYQAFVFERDAETTHLGVG